MEEFEEILIHSLRRSDCISRNGKNFLVLLQEATEIEADDVKERIFSRLNKIPAEEISYERESIF